jgi:hypothetical protein
MKKGDVLSNIASNIPAIIVAVIKLRFWEKQPSAAA